MKNIIKMENYNKKRKSNIISPVKKSKNLLCGLCNERIAITYYILADSMFDLAIEFLSKPNSPKIMQTCLECSLCISSQVYNWDSQTINRYIKKELELYPNIKLEDFVR